jgi:hypothetical protein
VNGTATPAVSFSGVSIRWPLQRRGNLVDIGTQKQALPVTGADGARLVLVAVLLVGGGTVLRSGVRTRRSEGD